MKRFLLILLGLLVLDVGTASAATLQLCVKADRMVQGQPREGSKIVLRAECKRRGNGTPIEVSIGTTDSMGSGQGAVSREEFDQLQQALLVHTCGDGDLEPLTGEQCDDGGLVSGDGCNALCQIEEGWACQGKGSDCDIVCGDGVIVAPEVCDDGNLTGGDGCSANCRSNETCGNGIVDTHIGEACDDGGVQWNDGCGATCVLERCGDGYTQITEACDDGNTVGGDGCSAGCGSDETCGNDVVDSQIGEVCDDGNLNGCDGCASDCRVREGVCGDGIVECDESCDDGNLNNGDGCDANCQPSICSIDQQCADGHCCEAGGCVARECCGNTDCGSGQLCEAGLCVAGCSQDSPCPGGYECQEGLCVGTCTSGCWPEENCWWESSAWDECRGSHHDTCAVSGRCDADCWGPPGCFGTPEGACRCMSDEDCPSTYSCSGGYCSNGNPCSGDNDCPVGSVCREGQCVERCEADCAVDLHIEEYLVCGEPTCVPDPSPDGCFASGGSCTAGCGESCAADTGPCACVPGSCASGHTCLEGFCVLGGPEILNRCGDATMQWFEVCDDGNRIDGDGCSANCLSDESCGNGVADQSIGEECDDGNVVSDDGCSATCRAEGCGDGIPQSGEVCDDGNRIGGDGCSGDCQSNETCGNGVTDLTVGEECDSGTTVGQGWCKADCTFSEEYDKITGLWQLNPVWGYWGGAHIVVVEGDTVLFSKRRGTNGGTTPGAPQCDRRYSMESSGLSYLDGDCAPLELLFSSSTTGRLGFSSLRQVVSCPGKSLEQIEAGECVPIPSPSGAFLDGMSRW